MKQTRLRTFFRFLSIGFLLLLSFACLAFLFVHVNQPILESKAAANQPEDRQAWEAQAAARLRQAPWQGLRYLAEQNEWRFYALAGESDQIDLITRFDLLKVYYLDVKGNLNITWVSTGLDLPDHSYLSTVTGPITEGDLVEVVLGGEAVSRSGVRWELCGSRSCRLAGMVDHILILDDEGTGITNGFIRYGWAPPTYPLYGFLCWEVRPASSEVTSSPNQESE